MTVGTRSTFTQRLARRAADAPVALCAGIDPSPDALALLGGASTGTAGARGRVARAGAIERFAGLLIESVRDHAVAVKPQLAWFEAAGPPGMRALERTVAFARTAGLLVVLDGKRGDVPHSAAGYADAWLGDDAASGIGGDALTVNASLGADALDAMASVAAERSCAVYALLHTSNPGAAELQGVLGTDGRPWWHVLAAQLAECDERSGRGTVGAVVGATHAEALAQARQLLPHAPLLVPGLGAQGGDPAALHAAAAPGAPTTLVAVSRSLLPGEPAASIPAFRHAVDSAARAAAASLRDVGIRAHGSI